MLLCLCLLCNEHCNYHHAENFACLLHSCLWVKQQLYVNKYTDVQLLNHFFATQT